MLSFPDVMAILALAGNADRLLENPSLLFIRAIALRFLASYVCIGHELGQVRGQQPVASCAVMMGPDWHPPGRFTTESLSKIQPVRVLTVFCCSRGGPAVYWDGRIGHCQICRYVGWPLGLGLAGKAHVAMPNFSVSRPIAPRVGPGDVGVGSSHFLFYIPLLADLDTVSLCRSRFALDATLFRPWRDVSQGRGAPAAVVGTANHGTKFPSSTCGASA